MDRVIHVGDCRDVLKTLAENSVDAVVTDPPYELNFMGKSWDATGISYDPAVWAEVLRVLKPGAHLLAFGGTRTYHRLACAIEDAGFEIRDQMQWIYGQGMPKARTVLKPAHEPICVARKPLSEKSTAKNFAKWGTGNLRVDESRVPFANEADERESKDKNRHADFGTDPGGNKVYGDFSMVPRKNYNASGRFPTNVLLDEEAAAQLDAQSGEGPSPVGGASRFFWCAKANPKEREGNPHPTVKPVALMTYLLRLATPINGTVLDPFMGSGTTAIAARNLDLGFVGIELEAEYVEIAKKRLGVE